MAEDIRGTVAEDLLSLMPLYHKHIFRLGAGISGLQAARFRVLGLLMKTGPLPMSEIGRRLYISKPSMTALADSLTEEGLIERHPDPSDRRVINIGITPKGKKHLKEFFASYRNDVKVLLSGIGDDDLRTLRSSLKDIRRVLAKIP